MKKLFLFVLLIGASFSSAQQNTPIDSFLPTVVRFHGAPPLVIPCLAHQIAFDEVAANIYFCNAAGFFQIYSGASGGGVTITTVAGLASISGKTNGTIAVVTNGNSLSDCTAGGGTTLVTCQFSGATWSQLIAASSGSTAFSALTPGTNTSGALVCGTGCSFTVSGTGTNNATNLNGTSLAALATGLLKNTTITGVPSIGVAGTDYVVPSGSITGTSGGLSGTPSITVNGITATTYNGGAFSGTFTGTPTFSGNIAFSGTPTFANPLALGSSTATTQTVGTNNTTLATTAFVIANATGSAANVALSNLSAVAVNAALSPGADATISLDGLSKRYVNAWLSGVFGWTNGAGTADTGISRDSAGVVDFGNGTAGDTSGTAQATAFKGVGTNGGLGGTEGTGANAGTAGAGTDLLYPDSTNHCWHENVNNVDIGCDVAGGTAAVTSGDLASYANTTPYRIQDSNVVAANVTTQTANGATNQVCTYTGANKVCVPGSVTNAMLGGSIALTNLATQAADTMVANMTAGTAAPTAVAMPTTAHGVWLGEGTATPPAASAAGSAGQIFTSGGGSADGAYADFPERFFIPAANCNNTTAGAGWSIPSGGTVTCRAGTNNLGGYVTITDTPSTFAQFTVMLPFDWDAATRPYIRFYFSSASDTTNGHTVIPQIKVSCPTATNGTTSDDATFSAAQSSSTVTFGASAVANGFYGASNVQIGSTQMTGCVAGGMMIVQVGRATDTATGNINFYGADVTFPRLLVVQAN